MNDREPTPTADVVGSPATLQRWLHVWAILTVLVTLVLLVLGQFVTSFRAGMADPIWPTEPWYLFIVGWQEPNRGYLIEHSHRIAGWVVGGVVSILALGLWGTERKKFLRWFGWILLVGLLGAYGQFHRELIAQRDPSIPVHVSTAPLAAMGSALLGVLILALAGSRGKGLRVLAVVALVAVMIQGLLGGFRVRLDALFGRELAPVHGIFAQVVFGLLVSIAALTARPPITELPETSRRILGRLSFALVGLLFVQLIWGAMVRHAPNALNQRLHLLTAFLAVALAFWMLRAGFTMAGGRARIAVTGTVLGLLIVLQVALGVEAWMGKFGEEANAGKAAAARLAEAEPVNVKQAAMRTAHTLVGTGVLAAAVVFALRIRQKKVDVEFATRNTNALWERMMAPEPATELNAPGKMP